MSYPKRLLPKQDYKNIDTDSLPDNACLLRTTNLENYTDSLGRIKIDAILLEGDYNQVFDLSVNLLGIYVEEDKKYKLIDKELIKLWKEGDDCPKHVNDNQYEIDENIKAIFFEVKKIHQKEFPYTKTIDNSENQFEGISLVEHVPTHGNFWHYQLFFKDVDGKIIKSGKSGWVKNLRGFLVKSYLKKFARPTIDSVPALEEKIYTR